MNLRDLEIINLQGEILKMKNDYLVYKYRHPEMDLTNWKNEIQDLENRIRNLKIQKLKTRIEKLEAEA